MMFLDRDGLCTGIELMHFYDWWWRGRFAYSLSSVTRMTWYVLGAISLSILGWISVSKRSLLVPVVVAWLRMWFG